MSVTKESILKAILLKEFDRMQPDVSTFEDDPMQFILRKYEGLNKTLTYLMTPSFQDYITGIYIVAPKPTTFKVVLHNGQFFFLEFTGKTYEATVAGKGYYLMNIGEKERCMRALARLLRYGNPLKTKGPEGAEQGTREGSEAESTGGEAGSEVPEATPEGGEEEALAEARILEEVLKKTLYTEKFKQLSLADLKKRGFRFDVIYDKIKNNKPFLIGADEKPIKLKFLDPKYEEAFKLKDTQLIKSFSKSSINKFKFFVDDQGNEYSIGDLLKDKDFGGKGSGSGTVVEDYTLSQLKNSISKLVDENGGPINVIFNGKKYQNIIGAEKPDKTFKCDFYLVSEGNNPIFYISHKKAGGEGPSGKDFIRWSGYTQYKEHPEVKKFVKALENEINKHPEWNGGIPNETNFISKVKDQELIKKLIYGSNFGDKKSGVNNVGVIFQGGIKLTPTENEGEYKISAEKKFVPPQIPSGDYAVYLAAKYRSDRNMFGIKNNEAIAITKANANAASNVYELKKDEFIQTKPSKDSK